MKHKLLLPIIGIVSIIIFATCQKIDANIDNPIVEEQDATLNDKSFSPNFDWQSSRNISISITSTNPQILSISSTDKSVRYYKGMHQGASTQEVIKLWVPTSVTKLIINNKEVELNSNNISIAL